ncbi:MAG: hypothetical protein ACKO5F_06805 [Synechococcus sp.]
MRRILIGLVAAGITLPGYAQCRDDQNPFAGERPPSGALLATCGDAPGQVCGVKIIESPDRKTLYVWHPARVQSAVSIVYTGSSFEPGSRWIGSWDNEYVVKKQRKIKSFDGKTLIWLTRDSDSEPWGEEVEFTLF